MDFPGQKGDTVSQETRLFEFITTCINDLKLKLVSVKPSQPTTTGRVTTFGYDIEVEGDFFKFGELCSKFENSRRIIAVETFDVNLITQEFGANGPGAKGIRVVMRVSTFRVKKDLSTAAEAAPVNSR
jgi:Tfp pilus assembly protein PilO